MLCTLQRYAQLYFRVEAVEPSTHFPLGVRTFYRAYPTDTAIELCPKPMMPFPQAVSEKILCSLSAYQTIPYDRPTKEDNNSEYAGMQCLKQIPSGELKVARFKDLSDGKGNRISVRKYLESVVADIKKVHIAEGVEKNNSN